MITFSDPNVSNILSNKSSNTNCNDFIQNARISLIMTKEVKKLKDMISSMSDVNRLMPEVSLTSQSISRFAPTICNAEIPKCFQTTNMKLYDGTNGPEEHFTQYMEGIQINPIPVDLKIPAYVKDLD